MIDKYIDEIGEYIDYWVNKDGSNNFFDLKNITPFGFCLKFFRLKNNISQKELAEIVNISENSIYNYENGKSRPTKNNRRKIMNYFNLSDNDLLIFEKILLELRFEHEANKKNEAIIFKNLKSEISDFDDEVLALILSNVFLEKKLSLEEIEKVINGYRMLTSNYNYKVTILVENPNYKYLVNEKKLLLTDKRSFTHAETFYIKDFIDEILIPLAEKLDYLFLDYRNKAFRTSNINNINLSDKYDTLQDLYIKNITKTIDKNFSHKKNSKLVKINTEDLTNMIIQANANNSNFTDKINYDLEDLKFELTNRMTLSLYEELLSENKKQRENKEGGSNE